VAQQEDNTSAVELVREIYDMVDGWLAKLSPDQERRLYEAADRLYSVASEIDQENWQRHGHA
jgi:hypothetical protein